MFPDNEIQYDLSSYNSFFHSIFVQMNQIFENPAVWNFLYFVIEFPMGWNPQFV